MEQPLALIAFVLRCTLAATIAFLLAGAVGLTHPLWACIFALIASQGQSTTTFATIGGRVVGTVIGVVVAVGVGTAMGGTALAAQTAVAVALCAVFAWRRPEIQVCMWTPPIVLMTADATESVARVGFYRGCEVVLGGLIGGLLLVGSDKIGAWAKQKYWRCASPPPDAV
jgi:uncharacterized membrane protein YgaE (UPF0421/DUF939 family)